MVVNNDLTDDIGATYWRTSKDKAIEYLYLINSATPIEEIELIREKVEALDSSQKVLISVAEEVEYIRVDNDMGIPISKYGKETLKKFTFILQNMKVDYYHNSY